MTASCESERPTRVRSSTLSSGFEIPTTVRGGRAVVDVRRSRGATAAIGQHSLDSRRGALVVRVHRFEIEAGP